MRVISLSLFLLAIFLSLAHAEPITGTVVDPEGAPVAGAQVFIWLHESTGASTRSTTTDAAGVFTTDVSPPPPPGVLAGRVNIYSPEFAVGGGVLRKTGNTFVLQPAGQAWGSVVDTSGRPVAGAQVRLSAISGPEGERRGSVTIMEPLQDLVSAVTTGDGRWVIQHVPSSGIAHVWLDDPRFVATYAQVPLGPSAPPSKPIVARPGAVIAGRIRFGTGSPAPDMEVFAQGSQGEDGYAHAVSDADGRYQLRGLPSGSYNVMADDKSGRWVAAALEGVGATEGETTNAPDLVLTAGAIVTGEVTDAATGYPIPGVYIGSYGPHRPRSSGAIIGTTSDEQGRYRLRVAPGESYIYISGTPPEYLRPEQGVTVTVAAGATATVPFRLQRGLAFAATVADEAGRPVPQVVVSLTGPIGTRYSEESAMSDDAGEVSVSPLLAGHYAVGVSDAWEVVRPTEVVLPQSAAVTIVVRPARMRTLTGRVVSPSGVPIPGAEVTAQVIVMSAVEEGTGMGGTRRAVTGADGTFALPDIPARAEVRGVKATKEGYSYVSGGEVSARGETLQAADIVLAPLTASVSGQVVDTEGAPVAGALVICPEGAPGVIVQTDSAGRFTLESVPPGEPRVIAAHDRSFGEAHASGGAVAITLAPALPLPSSDILRGFAILLEVQRAAAGTDYYAIDSLPVELAAYDPDLALRLAQGPDGTVPSQALAGVIFQLADRDPARALKWAPPHLAQLSRSDPMSLIAVGILGLAAAGRQPELAADLHRQLDEAVAAMSKGDGGGPVTLFLRAYQVALAGRLGDPAAEGLLTDLIAATRDVTAQQGGRDRGLMEAVVEGVAKGSPALAERAIALSGLEEPQRLASARARAIESLADYDAEAAYRMFSAMTPPREETAAYYYAVAAKRLIDVLGPQDPARALAIAETVTLAEERPIALAMAARFQRRAQAAALFREAQQGAAGKAGVLAWIAALAMEVDPALGAELFATAHDAQVAATRQTGSFDPRFAFYYGRVDPAEARVIMESEFARRRSATAEEGPFVLTPPILAMAAVDVDRALEMARAIPSLDAQRKIAQYVLAPDSVRRTLAFDRWNASDTWIPGTPTGW
jgi:protocatechuate 3,4-dioxygenase beta subunit